VNISTLIEQLGTCPQLKEAMMICRKKRAERGRHGFLVQNVYKRHLFIFLS